MADQEPKGPPPVSSKSKGVKPLGNGERADIGGDPYDRSRQQYSKTPPQTDTNSLLGD